MTHSPKAKEIARRLDKDGPNKSCALGLALHEAELEKQAEVVQSLCDALDLDLDMVLTATDLGSAATSKQIENLFADL